MIAIGIDAGGTSTTAIASIDGKTGEPVTFGPANFTSDFDSAIAIVRSAIQQAIFNGTSQNSTTHEVLAKSVTAVVVGAAGAGDETTCARIETALRNQSDENNSQLDENNQLCHPEEQRAAMRLEGSFLAKALQINVYADTHIALRAAVPQDDGIVLIAGTGSIAWAEIGNEVYRAGGHGYVFGDEGSGFAIGKAAIQLLARANDGRSPRDAFIEELASAVPNIRELYVLESPVPAVAKLAPLVLAVANRGERSASRIVQTAALALAGLLKQMPGAQRELPLVLAGGLLRENSLLTYLLETHIANEFPLWHVIKNSPPPHIGALRIAERLYAG